MKIFTILYNKSLGWAKHRLAPHILAVLTFAESVFFPIPPDVMLAPMVLAKPHRAWRYATITTIASLLGGIAGYALGYYMFEPWIQPLITEFGYQVKFDRAVSWFNEWGVWIVFIAGFSPVPYKLFTVSAGFLNMLFLPFVLASAISRGLRFFLVAGLIHYGGEVMEAKIRKSVDVIGWGLVALVIILYFIMR